MTFDGWNTVPNNPINENETEELILTRDLTIGEFKVTQRRLNSSYHLLRNKIMAHEYNDKKNTDINFYTELAVY